MTWIRQDGIDKSGPYIDALDDSIYWLVQVRNAYSIKDQLKERGVFRLLGEDGWTKRFGHNDGHNLLPPAEWANELEWLISIGVAHNKHVPGLIAECRLGREPARAKRGRR